MFVNDIKSLGNRDSVNNKKLNNTNPAFKAMLDTAQQVSAENICASTSSINLPLQWQLPFANQKAVCSYGDDMLDLLKTLHRHIILGGDVQEVMSKLQQETEHKAPLADDAELNELISAIKLRAAVEVAKRRINS